MGKLPTADWDEERLIDVCRDVATICCSHEFHKLHKEMLKLYRRNGVQDAQKMAFQDSLFAIYLEYVVLQESNLSRSSV